MTVSLLGSTTWRSTTSKGHCALCGIPHYKAIAYAQWIQFAAKIKMNVRL